MGCTTSIIWHDLNDHNLVIQYNYKSNCKHLLFFFPKNLLASLHIQIKKLKNQISILNSNNVFRFEILISKFNI